MVIYHHFHIHTRKPTAILFKKYQMDYVMFEIWNNLKKMDVFVEDAPTAGWQHIGILSKYTGDQLFCLTNSNIQKILFNNKTLMCVSSDWVNLEVMETLYNHYLKKK